MAAAQLQIEPNRRMGSILHEVETVANLVDRIGRRRAGVVVGALRLRRPGTA